MGNAKGYEWFLNSYWQYYQELEKEFLETRRYVDFQKENHGTYSVEFLKLFQAACSEIDTVGKAMAKNANASFKPNDAKNNIVRWWLDVQDNYTYKGGSLEDSQATFANGQTLRPWKGFAVEMHKAKDGSMRLRLKQGCETPDWWKDYNKVKHNRMLLESGTGIANYAKANLGNVMASFAALYILEKACMDSLKDPADACPEAEGKLFA